MRMHGVADGPPIGVIGIGNVLLRDEGIGVHAVRALKGQLSQGNVRLIDGGTDPWSALSAAQGCAALIVLDAVVGGEQPGQFHTFALEELELDGAVLSLHGVTLFHLLRYERLLGRDVPHVRVLGMEPATVEPGVGLSEACRRNMPAFVAMAAAQIRSLQEHLSGRQGGV